MAYNVLVLGNSSTVHKKVSGQCSEWYDLALGSPVKNKELDLIFMCPFQLEIYDSMKYRGLGVKHYITETT